MENDIYVAGFIITAIILFIGTWIIALGQWGFLLGVALGWIPAGIVVVIGGAVWPLLVIGIFYLFVSK